MSSRGAQDLSREHPSVGGESTEVVGELSEMEPSTGCRTWHVVSGAAPVWVLTKVVWDGWIHTCGRVGQTGFTPGAELDKQGPSTRRACSPNLALILILSNRAHSFI